MKITKEQTKIIGMIIAVLFFLASLLIFFYLPARRKFSSIQKELDGIQAQIDQINLMLGEGGLTRATQKFMQEFDSISGRLIKNDEVAIRKLSDMARSFDIEISSLTPLETKVLDRKIADYNIEEKVISLSLSCNVKQLGEYLFMLRTKFPYLIELKDLSVQGSGEGNPRIKSELKLSVFLSK